MQRTKRLVAGVLIAGALAVSGIHAFGQPRGCPGACIRTAQAAIRACFVAGTNPETTEACVRTALAALEACLATCN